MYLVISSQVHIFAMSILLGAALAMIYDIFRIYRIILRYSVTAVAFQDAAYCFIAGASVLLFFTALNDGEIRLYGVVGMALGALLYFKTVSRLVVGKLGAVLKKIKRKTVKKVSPVAQNCKKKLKNVKKHFKKRKKHSIINKENDVKGRKKRGKAQTGHNILSAHSADSGLHRGADISGSRQDSR